MGLFKIKILKFAFPLILSNLTISLLGIINTIIVGHLSQSYYLGAVSIGEMIFNLLYWSFGFLRMSTTSFVAQNHNQKIHSQQIILHSLFIALIFGVSLLILQLPIEKIAFSLIDGSPILQEFAKNYYRIRIWAAPAVFINLVLVGSLVGLQNTSIPLILIAIVNILATIFGVIFVFYFGMDVDGVALANVIAQYAGMVYGLTMLRHFLKNKKFFYSFKLNSIIIKKLFSANFDIFIRTLCIILVFSFFTIESSKLGTNILAANTILLNLLVVVGYVQDGFANATEALVGKHAGAKDYKKVTKAIIDTAFWVVPVAIGFFVIYGTFGIQIINLMTSLSDVRSIAYGFIIFIAIMPLISSGCFFLDGIFIGLGRFKSMRNTTLLSLGCFFIVWMISSSLVNIGLWIAFTSFFLMRSLSLGIVVLKLILKKQLY